MSRGNVSSPTLLSLLDGGGGYSIYEIGSKSVQSNKETPLTTYPSDLKDSIIPIVLVYSSIKLSNYTYNYYLTETIWAKKMHVNVNTVAPGEGLIAVYILLKKNS